nr:reverse transcriptase domain-containing protein [Tanacetum cinerariifolium]
MAARITKTPGDHRRRHPFYQSMDELHDCKVVVTFQRYHRKTGTKSDTSDTSSVTPREKKTRPANLTVTLHPNFPDQEVVVRGSLSDKGRTELCTLLKKNLDIFAWQPSDMTGVPRSIAEHRLNIREGCPSVRQKKKGQAFERTKAIQAEVQKLVEARIMREVYYHDWLSNPVMVKKHDGSWWMCVDFTDLNKACPQDCYPLAEIDWKRSPDDRKGDSPDDSLLYKPYITGSGTKLLTDGKTGFITGLCKKRLRIYFQTHPITVITDQPIKQVRPRTSIKGQILADFLNEMPGSQGVSVGVTQEEPWTLFTDGSSCADGPGAGLILTNPEGVDFTYALRFQFVALNNEAEYEALIAGLRIATQMGVKNVQANVDSKLVANQVLGTYVAKEDNMIKYLEIAKGLVSGFKTFSISQVPQSRNKKADALSKIASTSFSHLSIQVLVEVLETKSITGNEVTAVIEDEGPTWMTELVNYLKEGPLQAEYVMKEIHEGSCSMHARPSSVVAKAIRLGYFWPTMHKDAQDMIRRCSDYQIHCPFLEGPGKVKFLIVAMDYFTKWIEAKAVATITGGQVKKFVWDNIVCRFAFASIKHPQSNGLVERANRSLGDGIKARMGEGNKNWVEELPHVLWAHRTMIKSSHGDTPFSLTYGTKAVIPAEIEMPTYRTTAVDVVNNDEELRLNLYLLEERRELAVMSEAKSKSKMMKNYNSRVRGVAFKLGDFVYRSNDASHAVAGGKLGPKWKGPYEVTDAL